MPRAKSGVQVRLAVVGVVFASTALAACSYLPDAANPTTWNWRRLNPASWFEGDSAKTQTAAKAAPQQRPTLADRPGTDQPFPSVNSTPAKPTPPPAPDRRSIAQGLQADRDNARYTDEVLRASGPAAAPPPPVVAAAPPPAPPPAATQVARVTEPPPPAAPTTTVPAPEPAMRQPVAAPAPPAPLPQLATTPPVAPTRAVPVPSFGGVAMQQQPITGRAVAIPVPSVLDRPQPSPTTPPVSAQPIPSVVPAQSTYTQATQMTQVTVPAGAASGGMPVASSLPSRPGVQVNPSGPAALPSGFVPGSGRTPLLARVYAQGLAAQQARSVAEIPAGFQAPGAQPIGQFVTDVPPIVQQSFNSSLAQYPPSMPVNPAVPAASATVATAGVPAAASGGSGAALIHFNAGVTRISANMRELLSGVVTEHRQRGGLVRVIGYANGPGHGDGKISTNTSLARAQAVSRELVRLGIPSASLVTEGLGDTRPIFDESTSAGAAENRRVEIYLE